jgi:3-oxoacyl-[acyl-carrier protein] reductase
MRLQPPAAGADDRAADLDGRAVLVRGAGALPAAIARAAGGQGALVDLSVEDDVDVGCDAGSAAGQPASPTGMEHAIDTAVSRFSRLDAVIAVVRVRRLPPLHELSRHEWERLVVEPLRRVFWLARRSVEEFLAEGAGGRIVLIVDASAGVATGGSNPIVEQALVSLARSVAREYGRREVACNVLLAAGRAGSGTPAAVSTHPDRTLDGTRTVDAAALIRHALFLASPAASFMNGEALVVDDGGFADFAEPPTGT